MLTIKQWIPELELDDSEKEKRAMYVQDLYAVLHCLWANDLKPVHGRFRVQIALILLISGATTTRPGALVESGSCQGSNKALKYEHVRLVKVRNPRDSRQTSLGLLVSLVHIKKTGEKSRR